MYKKLFAQNLQYNIQSSFDYSQNTTGSLVAGWQGPVWSGLASEVRRTGHVREYILDLNTVVT